MPGIRGDEGEGNEPRFAAAPVRKRGTVSLATISGVDRRGAAERQALHEGAGAGSSSGRTAARQKLRALASAGATEPLTTNHNLPAPRSSFVGREQEMLEIKRELAMTRLLTLTGAGGSGKTRR